MKELFYIGHLENNDFKNNGQIKIENIKSENNDGFGLNSDKHKKILLMIQANFCGHCTTAKPAFIEFNNENDDICCLTVRGDDERESVKKLMSRINNIIPDFRGFPHYVLYDKNGKIIQKELKDRSKKGLEEFVRN